MQSIRYNQIRYSQGLLYYSSVLGTYLKFISIFLSNI